MRKFAGGLLGKSLFSDKRDRIWSLPYSFTTYDTIASCLWIRSVEIMLTSRAAIMWPWGDRSEDKTSASEEDGEE